MGTAAHVVEPILPGARDSYLDLGRFYDTGRLEKRKSELAELNNRYKAAYREAYAYLAAAGKLQVNNKEVASVDNIRAAVNNCKALIPAAVPGAECVRHCFIDAFCGRGRISLLKEFDNWTIYNISASEQNGNMILAKLSNELTENKYGCFCAYSPFDSSIMHHLIVPCHKIIFTMERVVGCPCAAALSNAKPDEKLLYQHNELMICAEEMLAMAKSSHDALEEVYNPCVDFGGIYTEAQKHINAFL